MDHIVLYVDGAAQAETLNAYIAEGWTLHPELKVVRLDSVAIYHLVKYGEDETPVEDVKAGEFDDVVETRDVPHGPVPEGFTVHAIYQKNLIVVRKKVTEAE